VWRTTLLLLWLAVTAIHLLGRLLNLLLLLLLRGLLLLFLQLPALLLFDVSPLSLLQLPLASPVC
jgi:hypothetical protein